MVLFRTEELLFIKYAYEHLLKKEKNVMPNFKKRVVYLDIAEIAFNPPLGPVVYIHPSPPPHCPITHRFLASIPSIVS